MNKSGQVTIYIIIGIIILVGGILIYFFWPKEEIQISGFSQNPQVYLEHCIMPSLKENIQTAELQGGELNPENSTGFYTYQGEKDTIPHKIRYLCYASDYYEMCANQQPFLKEHIQKEISKSMSQTIDNCLNEMVADFKTNGYEIKLKKGPYELKFHPKKVTLILNDTLTISKKTTKTYKNFELNLKSNIFELADLASDIVQWEVDFGDMDTSSFMRFYPKFLFEKKLLSGGTKIYIITYLPTNEKFQFASRSKVWPMGYGL